MESLESQVQRALADMTASGLIRSRYKRKWQEARDAEGVQSDRYVYYYSRYLSECRTYARTKRWYETCLALERFEREKVNR